MAVIMNGLEREEQAGKRFGRGGSSDGMAEEEQMMLDVSCKKKKEKKRKEKKEKRGLCNIQALEE